MKDKEKTSAMDKLFACVLRLENIDECYDFFEDICTINELKAMSQRLEVAMMLMEGKTYIEIGEKTGVSTATISRVNRSLQHGADGYKIVLPRVIGARQQEPIVDETE